MKCILVTGATGFVGQAFCERAISKGWKVRAALRTPGNFTLPTGTEVVTIKSIGAETSWTESLAGVDTVIHLAARVHVMKDTATDPLTAFREVNVAGTEALARCAAASGVRRFVFMSSIKVIGEGKSEPYTELDQPLPKDSYAVSKWEAEQILRQIAESTRMEVVILRPPLVYGPGVKANFLKLLKLVDSGIPLPFGSIDNHRSLIYLGNLVDAIMTSITHAEAAGNTYLVSDSECVSTRELVCRLGRALDKPARLLVAPVFLLKLAGLMFGKTAAENRLTGSLVIDITKIMSELGWCPPFTMDEGLRDTAQWFKTTCKKRSS
jgi:nucleoside-diphosphate-sugar epimerase